MEILKLILNCVRFFLFVLIVCFEVFIPLENFSLIWRRHHDRWRAAYFDRCSALLAVVHWRFFGLPHLLWHRASLYAGHLQGPVAPYLLPTVWQWSCQYLFYNLGLSRLGFEHPTFRLRGECSNLLRQRRVHFLFKLRILN